MISFIKEKGIHIVAKTAKIVKSELPDIQFSLAGRTVANVNKINFETVESWVAANLIDSINFYPNILDFYYQQTIILLPTTYNEGLPAIAMECQSLGIPILMNNIPQLQNAVPKELAFHLVDNNDTKIYAEIIIRYFKSPELFSNASKLSHTFARAEFDSSKMNKKIFNFIFEVALFISKGYPGRLTHIPLPFCQLLHRKIINQIMEKSVPVHLCFQMQKDRA